MSLPSKLRPASPIPPRSEKSHRVREVGWCGGETGGVGRRGVLQLLQSGVLEHQGFLRPLQELGETYSISGKLPLTTFCLSVYPLRKIQ